MILQQLPIEDYNAEAGSEKPWGTVPDSLLTKFLLEVYSLTFFCCAFSKRCLSRLKSLMNCLNNLF